MSGAFAALPPDMRKGMALPLGNTKSWYAQNPLDHRKTDVLARSSVLFFRPGVGPNQSLRSPEERHHPRNSPAAFHRSPKPDARAVDAESAEERNQLCSGRDL